MIGRGLIVQQFNRESIQELVDQISTEARLYHRQQQLYVKERQRQQRLQRQLQDTQKRKAQKRQHEESNNQKGAPADHLHISMGVLQLAENEENEATPLPSTTTTTTTTTPTTTITSAESMTLPIPVMEEPAFRKHRKRDREKISQVLPFVESFCWTERCQWLYRFNLLPGSEIFGPFLTSDILNWLKEGWFSSVEEVWIKAVDCVVYLEQITERGLRLEGGDSSEKTEFDFGGSPWISSRDIDLEVLVMGLGVPASDLAGRTQTENQQDRKRYRGSGKKKRVEEGARPRLKLRNKATPNTPDEVFGSQADLGFPEFEDPTSAKKHKFSSLGQMGDERKRAKKNRMREGPSFDAAQEVSPGTHEF